MRRGYAMLMVLATLVLFVAVVVANAAYARHVQQQSDRRWCALLGTLDQPQAPATTERGKTIQKQIHKLRADLEC